MATFFMRPGPAGNNGTPADATVGDDSLAGTSFATAWRTFTNGATAARIAPTDLIKVMKSPDPTSIGSATWTNKSDTVVLASALTTTVTNCETAWTGTSGVTTATSSTRRQGSLSTSIAINATTWNTANPTGGKIAYLGLGGTFDYSAYQQISFLLRVDVSFTADSASSPYNTKFLLKLCSDTIGDTAVDELSISLPIFTDSTSTPTTVWIPLVTNKGSALGSAIQSIAMYANATIGGSNTTFLLDNIIVCKALASSDAITHRSLLGKYTAGETYWAIRSIDGTTVKLDGSPQLSAATTPKGYAGVTETVTSYKRETIRFNMAQFNTTTVNSSTDSGTSGNIIEYSGGWNDTNMTTDGHETWLDGTIGTGRGLAISNNFLKFSNINFVKYFDNVNFPGGAISVEIGNGHFNNGANNGLTTSNSLTSLSLTGNIFACANSGRGISAGSADLTVTGSLTTNSNQTDNGCHFIAVTNTVDGFNSAVISRNNGGFGIAISTSGNFGLLSCIDNTSSGLSIDGNVKRPPRIKSLTTYNNLSYGVTISAPVDGSFGAYLSSGNGGGFGSISIGSINNVTWLFDDAIIADTIKVNATTSYLDIRAKLSKISGGYETYTDGGNIKSNSSDRNTASGISWELNPTTTVRTTTYPMYLSVCERSVFPNSLCTFTGYAKRSNSAISSRFRILGGAVAGVPDDIVINVTNVGTWNLYTTTFTPTENGVIEVLYEAYGGTTHKALVDDVDITQ